MSRPGASISKWLKGDSRGFPPIPVRPGEPPLPPWTPTARRVFEPLRRWHQHRVEGLEHVPLEGPVMGIVNHTLATYDAFLYGLAVLEHTGRVPVALGDDNLFAIPGLAQLVHDTNIRPASHAHAVQALREGRLVYAAPGGTREALRPSSERYEVRWAKRKGFVRLAVRTGTPLLLAACARGDDIFTVYENPLTALAYQHFRFPVPVVRGWGPTLLPRPVPLVHHIAPPIVPPPHDPEREDEQVDDVHADALRTMRELLSRR